MRRKKLLAVVLAAAMAFNMTGVSAAAQPAVGLSVFGKSVFGGLFGGDSSDKKSDDSKSSGKQTDGDQTTADESTGDSAGTAADQTDAAAAGGTPEASAKEPASSAKTANNVTLDIGRGDIVINKSGISAFDTEGNEVTKTSSQYVITGSSEEHSIQIGEGANANIVLSNVSIIRSAAGESPFWIADDSSGNVTVTLQGTNTLQGGSGAAAIQKNCNHTGSYDKCGRLDITCGNNTSSHVCDSNCGILNATGTDGAAAIGGAAGRGSSNINLKGGMITASGGVGGASGGVGTDVDIEAGMVNAGTINGKDGSASNLMNGDTLVFADSAAGLNAKRGILYQNGAGTVYGNVNLSEGLADYLPDGSELTIPAGATLTVGDVGIVPETVNVIGRERIKVDATPTPEPTEDPAAVPAMQAEEAPEEVVAQAEANARATLNTSIVTVSVTGPTDNTTINYNQQVRVTATVTEQSSTVTVSDDEVATANQVKFELINGAQSKTLGEIPLVDGRASIDVNVTSPDVKKDDQIFFKATYSGSSSVQGSSGDSGRYIIGAGILTASNARKTVIPGNRLDRVVDLNDSNLFRKPTNTNNTQIDGSWDWKNQTDENSIVWPTTEGSERSFDCIFIPTDNNYASCEAKLFISAPVTYLSESENANFRITPDKGGEDNWYNFEDKDIRAVLQGYYFFDFAVEEPDLPVEDSEWETAASRAMSNNGSREIKVDSGFYNGELELYVRQRTSEQIGGIYKVHKNFKLDQVYPVIEEFDYTRTGTVATLNFTVNNEDPSRSGSGVNQYICEVQQRIDGRNVVKPMDPKEVEDSLTTSTTGKMIRFTRLAPNNDYDVYVLVEDLAGNRTDYVKRIIGDKYGFISENDYEDHTPGSSAVPGEEDTEDGRANVKTRYGYAFETDSSDIDGTMTITVTDIEGNEKRGEVAYEDFIRVDFSPSVANPGPLHYSWWRAPHNSSESVRIDDADDSPVYQARREDIGYDILCRVNGTNTSALGYVQKGVGPVLKQKCPTEWVPTNGRVDNQRHTFTFTGLYNGPNGVGYEYCLDGGDSDVWTPVPDSNGSNDYVINVGDSTILAGKLLVRAKESDLYRASDTLANTEPFISSLEVKLSGETTYGETLTASVNAALDPGMINYQWSYKDGGNISNSGSTYDLQKGDIGKKIVVTASMLDNPRVTDSDESATIRKRSVTLSVNAVQKQYDGTTTAEATVEVRGRINNDDITATANVEFADKNAGTNKPLKVTGVKLEGADKDYYAEAGNASDGATGTILPRQLALNMTAQDKVYDGTTNAVVTLTTSALPGDSITVTGSGEFADKNVGTNKTVTSKDVQVGGTGAANYTAAGSTATATASITKKDIELEGITVADKYYDNTTDAVIAASFKGAVDEVQYTYKAAFDTPNVGKDKRVTATVTLTGDSATNYNLLNDSAVGTGNIVKALAPYEEANIPQNLTGVQGKKLSSVYIGNGFKWKDPNTIMETVGRHTYPAIYNPDASQYGDREIELEVLVQCSKHTWGEWTITQEPTKEEQGERQRICGVCGYTEVEIIPRAPYVSNEEDRVGWGDIIQAINNASSGTEIPVTMNGTETLPASVQEALQGRDVSLVLQMGDGITWTIRGEDITASVLKDINMALTVFTDNIPSDVIDSVAKGKTAIQLHLAYSGEFGFVATLRVPLGDEFAGIPSTLYYYNPTRERLEQMDKNKITADGIGRYDFTHASDYVVIVDKQADVQGGDTPSGNGNNGNNGNNNGNNGNNGTSGTVTPIAPTASPSTTSGVTTRPTSANNIINIISSNGAKTEDSTPIMFYVILLLAGAGAATGAVIYKRKKKTKE